MPRTIKSLNPNANQVFSLSKLYLLLTIQITKIYCHKLYPNSVDMVACVLCLATQGFQKGTRQSHKVPNFIDVWTC